MWFRRRRRNDVASWIVAFREERVRAMQQPWHDQQFQVPDTMVFVRDDRQ
jgi:hypothetical protein